MISLSVTEQDLLKNSGISGLILFGSQAQGIGRPDSDYDVLVLGKNTDRNYDLVYDLLSAKINKLVDIDIVFAGNAPLELISHTVKYGKILYQAKPSVFADFKARMILAAADFAPYRRLFQQATLSRINL